MSAPGNAATDPPFPDVPVNHWAYQSLETLQAYNMGFGYPNGTFGGKKVLTRYEFAVAIARLLPILNDWGDTNYASKNILPVLREDRESALAPKVEALDAVRKLVTEFTPELQNIGQDVAADKEELDALEIKMAAIEQEQRRVRFTGALNLIAEADSVDKGGAFVDGNGNTVGVDKHLFGSVDVHHDFVLDIRGRVADDTNANVKLDFGNYLSAIGNTAAPGYPPNELPLTPGNLTAAAQQTTVWEANIVGGGRAGRFRGGGITLGRFGNQWTPYTLEQVDADIYAQLDQTDSGDIPTDGLKFDLPIKRLAIEGWAGQMKGIPLAEPWGGPVASTTTQIGARPAGLLASTHAVALGQGDGLRVTYGHPDTGRVGVTVENFATAHSVVDPNAKTPYSLLAVYGLDYTGNVTNSGFRLTASLTDAATSSSSHGFNDTGNDWRYNALDTQIGRQFGSAWLQGGYQFIGPEFSAPGNWGRVASWINPANVEGSVASARVNLTRDCILSAKLADYHAAYGGLQHGGPINSPLGDGDNLTNYKIGIDYTGRAGYNTSLSYEQSTYDLKNHAGTLTNAGKPVDSVLTVGIGHILSKNTTFRVLYQYDQYADKGTGFGVVDSAGSVVSTQITARF